MSKIKFIISMMLTIIIVNGCKNDDLELVNPNNITPETFFKTEVQIQAAVTAAYANMQTRGLWTRHMFFSQDNMAQENEGNPQLEADKRQYLEFSFDSNHGPIADYWESCFRGINKANFVLDNAEAINALPESVITNGLKAKYLGEAKFLRGLYYFLLVTRFGDVPLFDGLPEGGEGLPRSPKSEVYQQIINDFREAAMVLKSKSEEETGRATSEAAIAMHGKTLLFLGEYGLALTEFEKLNGKFSLEPNFFDNFTEENEFGVESIFEIQYDDDLSDANKWDSATNGTGFNEVTFRGQEYGFNDWFNVYPSEDLLDEYEPGDTRYADTFYSVGDTFAGGTLTVTEEMLTAGELRRAGWKKYQNYYKDANEDQASGINFKYLRYGDVLLMMAECENEVGTQAAAVGYINQVRERAGLADLETTLSKEAVFDAIVHERKVELAGEQVRFNDILRWGNWDQELAGTNFNPAIHILWPIPFREISSNANINSADQNPGY